MVRLEDPRVGHNDTKVERCQHFEHPAGTKFYQLHVALVILGLIFVSPIFNFFKFFLKFDNK